MNSIINIAKPVFKPLCAKPVKQINKLKCPKLVKSEKRDGKTKIRERGLRVQIIQEPITAKQMVEQVCEKRKNLVEICMKKARMMAQRKADRNTKELNNYFF